MKDFYDVYIFLTKLRNEINISNFKKAFEKTLKNRDSVDSLKDYNKIFDEMLEYETIQNNWKRYSEKNKYAQNIDFKDIIEILRSFLKESNLKNSI